MGIYNSDLQRLAKRGEATEANFLGLAAGLVSHADRLYIHKVPMCRLTSCLFDSATGPVTRATLPVDPCRAHLPSPAE